MSIADVEISGQPAKRIEMRAVQATDEASDENRMFGTATPHGDLSMTIVNPDASAEFEQGKEYYIDFTPV